MVTGITQAQRTFGALGQSVRRSREAKGLTQQDLSDLSGIAQADISKLEHGRIVLSDLEIKSLSKALGWRGGGCDGDSMADEA